MSYPDTLLIGTHASHRHAPTLILRNNKWGITVISVPKKIGK